MNTTTMIPDETIRQCAVVVANGAREVHEALTMVVQARTPDGLAFASIRLRHALVLLAHDGGTFQARVAAARQALESWDGHKVPVETVVIRVGSMTIDCEKALAASLGYGAPYANDETRTARGGGERSYGSGLRLSPDQALSVALSEGFSGEAAVMRAIAIRTEGAESNEARLRVEAAKLYRQAAEAELRAEQIRSARQKRAEGA